MAINYDDLIDREARTEDVDPRLMKTILMMESSGGRNNVASLPDDPDSPIGPAQMRPSTGRTVGITDVTNPEQAVRGMARYLRQGLDATGTPQGALAHYFAGPDTSGWGPKTAAYVAKGTALYPTMTVQPGQSGDTAIRGAVNRARGGQAPSDDPDVAAGMDVLNAARTGAPSPTQQAAPAAKAGPVDPDVAAGLDALKTAREYKPPKTQQEQAAPDTPPTVGVDEYGRELGPGGLPVGNSPLGPGPETVGRVVQAAKEGYANTEPFLTPKGQAAVGPLAAGAVSTLVDTPRRAVNALVTGGMQGVMEATNALAPEAWGARLGRDIIQMAQVAPVYHAAPLEVPPVRPRPAGPPPPRPDAPPGPYPEIPPGGWRTTPEPPPASGTPGAPPEPTAGGPQPGMGGGVGADVTTSPIPPKTPVERVRDLEKAVLQTAEERAGPQLVDNAPYVPGIPARLLPSRDFSKSVNALDAKVASARDPAFRDAVDANARVRNEGMVDHLREGAGDLTALEQAHEARSAVSPSAMRVFEGEKPVDAAGLLAKIDETLNGPEGKQKAVRTTLSDVRASLFDGEGNLETMPSRLYGARRNLTDLLKKGVKGTGDLADDVRASKHILNGLLEDFDPLITDGAPRFTEYLKAWSEASKPIDQMEFLQNYFSGSKKITNDAGYLQPGKVQKMFDDVLQGHKARGVNKAKSLTDEQIARIEAVRNELQADQLRDRLASVRGSDTFQQFNSRMFGEGPVVNALRHGRDIALGAATGGIYNLGVKPIMETNRLRRIERKTEARKQQLLEEGPRNALGPD